MKVRVAPRSMSEECKIIKRRGLKVIIRNPKHKRQGPEVPALSLMSDTSGGRSGDLSAYENHEQNISFAVNPESLGDEADPNGDNSARLQFNIYAGNDFKVRVRRAKGSGESNSVAMHEIGHSLASENVPERTLTAPALDEPTGGLDPVNRSIVFEILPKNGRRAAGGDYDSDGDLDL